jgi:hypothetical protein
MSAQVAQASPSTRGSTAWLAVAVAAEATWLMFLVWMAWQA